MRATVTTQCRHWSTVSCLSLILVLIAPGVRQTHAQQDQSATAPTVQRTPAEASRAKAALATLRAHWDSEVITGAMVDEIKKVLDAGSSEDLEPLLKRLDLLKQAGDAYSPDFALWWDERGRNELGGKLFWKRDLLREAIAMALDGHNERETVRMLREAAATGDPVARTWQMFMESEMSGRQGPGSRGILHTLVQETRDLAESGDADAAFLLGLFAEEGDTDMISSTPEEMVHWLEMAAEAGYEHAVQMLVEVYGRGSHGVSRDLTKSRYWSIKGESLNPLQRAGKLRATSANNLKQLGLVGKMFANESRGERWPQLSRIPGQLAMDASVVYPEYLTDPNIYISPAHPDYYQLVDEAAIDPLAVMRDHSYWYLGYAIVDEAQGLELVKHVREAAEAGEALTDDIDTPGLQQEQIYRLNERIDHSLVPDAESPPASAQIGQSQIPIMIERPGMHEAGANVLYLDGHVEFIAYPGKFPMTEKFIQALESLDDFKS